MISGFISTSSGMYSPGRLPCDELTTSNLKFLRGHKWDPRTKWWFQWGFLLSKKSHNPYTTTPKKQTPKNYSRRKSADFPKNLKRCNSGKGNLGRNIEVGQMFIAHAKLLGSMGQRYIYVYMVNFYWFPCRTYMVVTRINEKKLRTKTMEHAIWSKSCSSVLETTLCSDYSVCSF